MPKTLTGRRVVFQVANPHPDAHHGQGGVRDPRPRSDRNQRCNQASPNRKLTVSVARCRQAGLGGAPGGQSAVVPHRRGGRPDCADAALRNTRGEPAALQPTQLAALQRRDWRLRRARSSDRADTLRQRLLGRQDPWRGVACGQQSGRQVARPVRNVRESAAATLVLMPAVAPPQCELLRPFRQPYIYCRRGRMA